MSKEHIVIDDITANNSVSLAALEMEEWGYSGEEPKAAPPPQVPRPKPYADLIRILAKAVEDLGLEWLAPDESAHGFLDKWFLPETHQQSSRHRPAPFLPAVHDELTKTWRAPYSSQVNPSTVAALTTVDGTDERGYTKHPPGGSYRRTSVPTICPRLKGPCSASI